MISESFKLEVEIVPTIVPSATVSSVGIEIKVTDGPQVPQMGLLSFVKAKVLPAKSEGSDEIFF